MRRWVAAAAAAATLATGCSLRPIDLQQARPLALRTSITAADGSVLARLYRENRALVPLDRIPEVLRDAVLAAEDARFFAHDGYDLRSMARAALANLEEGEVVQGGSTITQQYVKNTYFRDPERTFERKARELRFAIEIERTLSKREILERYLNTVYFGDGAYGTKAAAETFFRHGVASVQLHEAALLASLIKAPARYNPRNHPRRALARRNYILDRMARLGWVTAEQATEAMSAPLGVVEAPPRISLKEPYFVEAVRQELVRDRRLGPTARTREEALFRGGLRIETTLKPELQEAAERAVANVLDQPGDPAAALVAIRPSNGRILAMMGGEDWSASQVNLALGKRGGGSGRQPGSAFKPIVAAAALEAGIPLHARYDSGPWSFPSLRWSGTNAEGGGYGPLSIEQALVHSVNGVFARLALDVGLARIAHQGHLMGVRSRLPAYPSIALGSIEVSVLDMAAAFATLANGGTAIEPTTIARIRTAEQRVLPPEQRILPSAVAPGNAFLLTKALEQVIARGTGVAAKIGRPAAGKTGTTNDYGDAWFVGYTPELVAAVWVGYPQGRIPMVSVHGARVYGGTLPARIWRSFMLQALAGRPVRPFELPRSELVTVRIDPRTGLLAAPWCPGERRTMLRQLAPTQYCPVPPPSPSPLPTAVAAPSPTAPPAAKTKNGQANGAPTPASSASPSPKPRREKPSPSSSP